MSMKKFFVCIVFFMNIATSYAQEWESKHHEADPMKKTEAYDSFSFTDSAGYTFVFWSNNAKNFRIISPEDIFNYSGDARWVELEIGFYDTSGNFVEKIKTNGKAAGDDPTILSNMSFTKGAKKIISYIKDGKGSIRFLAPLYGKSQGMDFTVQSVKK